MSYLLICAAFVATVLSVSRDVWLPTAGGKKILSVSVLLVAGFVLVISIIDQSQQDDALSAAQQQRAEMAGQLEQARVQRDEISADLRLANAELVRQGMDSLSSEILMRCENTIEPTQQYESILNAVQTGTPYTFSGIRYDAHMELFQRSMQRFSGQADPAYPSLLSINRNAYRKMKIDGEPVGSSGVPQERMNAVRAEVAGLGCSVNFEPYRGMVCNCANR